MQCFPQQKTKKHSKKGICPKYIKRRCFTRPCEYSHSWNGTVAVLIQQKRQREAITERRQERRQRRERRHQRWRLWHLRARLFWHWSPLLFNLQLRRWRRGSASTCTSNGDLASCRNWLYTETQEVIERETGTERQKEREWEKYRKKDTEMRVNILPFNEVLS